MTKRSLHVFTLSIAALGAALFYYKWQVLGLPLVANTETDVWLAEVRVSMDAGKGPIKATLKLPALVGPGYSVLEESFISRGYGRTTTEDRGARETVWTIRRASGHQTLYYHVELYHQKTADHVRAKPSFPELPVLDEPYASALASIIDKTRNESADIISFTQRLISLMNAPQPSEAMGLFLRGQKTRSDYARLAVELLRGARIPAQLVHGLDLTGTMRRANTQVWLEVHDGDQWIAVDPNSGETGVPDSFLPWWYGDDPMLVVEGARNVSTTIAIDRSLADSLTLANRRAEMLGSRAVKFSLLGLPIQTQAVYAVMLMIPIGALVMVLLRNIVGVVTFGTFMPVLIAVSFRETDLLAGAVLFAMIVGLGLVARFMLDRFMLLLVPRLASVLIIVVLLMMAVSIVAYHLGIDIGLSIALFPMVIMTMTIERMSILWEERGATAALKAGAGSLVVAAVCHLAMTIDALEHLVFVFPEVLLIILAVVMELGRYSGYRLSELLRFRSMAAGGSG